MKKTNPCSGTLFAKPTEPMRRVSADEDEDRFYYVDPKHEKSKAEGWIRLREVLENAKQDERIAASCGAADFLELMSELAADSLTAENSIEVLRPLRGVIAAELLKDNKGRHKGGATMAAKKLEHLALLKDAVLPLLKNPATSDWSNPQIAQWLMDKNFHKHKRIELSKQTMTDRVDEIREEYKAAN